MQAYKVTKLSKFGVGQILGLSDAQIKPRKFAVEVVKKENGGAVVKSVQPVEFIGGEIIGLEEMPMYLAQSLEPCEAPKQSEAKPERASRQAPADKALV